MALGVLKRWRWAVAGLLAGLLLSWWSGSLGLNGSLQGRSTIDVTEFEQLVAAKSPSGSPRLKNIRYYGRENGTDWLIAEHLTHQGQGPNRTEVYVPVKVAAERPYVPKVNAPAKAGPDYTILDYLKSVQANNPQVRFSTGWWSVEPVRSVLWALVGLAVMVGAGPTLLNILNGGTIRAARENKESSYDLSRFGKGGASSTPPAKRGPTEAELAHVRELEAELERRLSDADALPESTPSSAQPPAAFPPVKKLDAGPLEAPPAAQKPTQAKQFDGEFYPTETHVKRDKS